MPYVRVYVGNLPFSATDEEVRGLFAEHGSVRSVALITRDNGRPRGFGFVEVDEDNVDKAVEQLNGYEMGGRALRVSRATSRYDGPST